MMRYALLPVLCLLAGTLGVIDAQATTSNSATRSARTVAAFKKANPPLYRCTFDKEGKPVKCTKVRTVVNHIKPLCDGGVDVVENMEYEEYAPSLKRDNYEREKCREDGTLK